jgi:hypothetical protein
MIRLVLVMLMGLSILGCSGSQQSTSQIIEVTYSFKPPTEGMSPVEYRVQEFDGNWIPLDQYMFIDDLTFVFKIEYGEEIILRVAGVDRLNRRGEWSEPSNP